MANIVPSQLFFSRLPTGELEFSCLVPVPESAIGACIEWSLRAAGNDQHSLACQQPVRDEEVRKGRVLLAAILPSAWPDSTLRVDLADGSSSCEVHRYRQDQRFGLPFATDALVVGGHRAGEPHRAAFDLPAQQFGWDLVGLGPDNLALLNGKLSAPPRSADFACFGQQVMTPAAGVVVTVVDDIADAESLGEQKLPDGTRMTWAAGNHVVIEHDNGVYSCLAHLQRGSIGVPVGQELDAGAVVGAVGTSGNTNGPHLHFHFMDGPDLTVAAPLPIELTLEGETFAPTSGQIVAP